MLKPIDLNTLRFIREHREEDVRTLALKNKNEKIDMLFALEQIQGWQTARTKLPSWTYIDGVIYPPHLSMEQCSSESTALYKSSIIPRCGKADTFVDLTGGYGVDFSFMSRGFTKAFYVERQENLCDIARNNFPLLGLQNADVIHGDGIEFLQTLEHVSVLFLDPARRKEHGSKAILLEDCTPNLLEIKELLLDKADTIVVKLSPMLDWHLAVEQLGSVFEVHVVSVGNECKELILVLRKDYIGTPTLYCVNDGNVFIVDKETKKATLPSAELVSLPLAKYLYEPNASIMKVGCFDEISSFYNISPLGKNSHLFVSAVLAEGFPGRTFKILRLCSMNKHDLRDALKNIDRANIAVRNFPMSAVELRKRLRLKDGGDVFIFGTTVEHHTHVLLLASRIS